MPKVVDPVARREDLARAVWRVVRREGLDRASVRAVAQEAGLSMGSLRHYFGTQSGLRIFAMRMVIERIQQRISALQLPDDPLQAAQMALAELLPLDPERQAENQVWLAFTAAALVDSDLRALRNEAYDLERQGCRQWVRRLRPTATAREVNLETDRLFALLDGLAVHAAMRPQQVTPKRLLAVLASHLDQVASC
jgi:AcrR family transcriptional regulator